MRIGRRATDLGKRVPNKNKELLTDWGKVAGKSNYRDRSKHSTKLVGSKTKINSSSRERNGISGGLKRPLDLDEKNNKCQKKG